MTDEEELEPFENRETQLGFRRPDGRVIWAWPQSDGTWTPWQPDLGLDAIDIYGETSAEDVARYLRPGFVVLSREIRTTYGPTTETPVKEEEQ